MNIHECHARYDIGMKKLRRMHRDGVLKLDKTPSHWQRLVSDIQKGKLSVRSIILAYRFPAKLAAITLLTARDRAVVQSISKRRAFRVMHIQTTGSIRMSPALQTWMLDRWNASSTILSASYPSAPFHILMSQSDFFCSVTKRRKS